MKSKVLVPVILLVFLAGPAVAFGQEINQKKIERLEKKIEKQHKKLQKLTGKEFGDVTVIGHPIAPAEIAIIRKKALEHADRARNEYRVQADVQREVMEAQREAMQEQREAMREQKMEIEEHMKEIQEGNFEKLAEIKELNLDKLQDLKKMEIEIMKDANGKKSNYYYKTPGFEWKSGEPMVVTAPNIKIDSPNFKGGVYTVFGGQDALEIEKKLAGETISADFPYEVKEDASGVSLSVNGSIDEGQVKITIKKPDGSVFNEYVLSPLANVSWNQSLNFEGDEETAATGKWTITVAAEKAKGTYKVQIRGR